MTHIYSPRGTYDRVQILPYLHLLSVTPNSYISCKRKGTLPSDVTPSFRHTEGTRYVEKIKRMTSVTQRNNQIRKLRAAWEALPRNFQTN